MTLPAVIQDRCDVFREPAIACLVVPGQCAVVGCEREGVCKSRSLVAFRGKGIDQVPHDGIGHAVSDEDDGEFAEQLGDEPCCPPFGQIRPPEVRRGKNQILAVVAGDDATVQMHEA